MAGNLWALGFDPSRLETVGEPVPVLEGVLTKNLGAADFSLSGNGSLVYVPGAASTPDARTLVWVDREGREEVLRAPPAPYEAPRISPDGRYVAVEVRNPENTDVLVYDLVRDTPTRLTFDPGADGSPIWSPDGRRVLFSSDRDGVPNVFARAPDGTGQAERVTTSDTAQFPQTWSADGQTLVVMDVGASGVSLLRVSAGADDTPESLIATDFAEVYAEVSPDGRWIAYMSDESGQFEVYVRPFPNVDDGRWQISRDGGLEPVWAPSGRELFFRPPGYREMMAVTVATEPTFSAGNPEPETVFATTYRFGLPDRARPWDLADDGRFLMIKEAGDQVGNASQIVVVEHWFEELKARVPIP